MLPDSNAPRGTPAAHSILEKVNLPSGGRHLESEAREFVVPYEAVNRSNTNLGRQQGVRIARARIQMVERAFRGYY